MLVSIKSEKMCESAKKHDGDMAPMTLWTDGIIQATKQRDALHCWSLDETAGFQLGGKFACKNSSFIFKV